MARIFISYSRKDEAFSRRLATSLSELGADVWIDVEDIPSGMKWSRAIQEGLDVSDVLLVVISPDSMASTNVEDEWQYYLDQRKPVIPVLLLPAKMHFQLSRVQYIDFHRQPYENALRQLHAELGRKGVHLNALPAATTARIQPQPSVPLHMPAERQTRSRNRMPLLLLLGGGLALVCGVVFLLALNSLSGVLSSLNNPNTGQTFPTAPPDKQNNPLPTTDPGQQIDQQVDQQTIPTGLPLGPYDSNSVYNANGVQFTYPQGWLVETINDAGVAGFITANSQSLIDYWKSDNFNLDSGAQSGQVAVTILPHAEQLYQSGGGLSAYDAVTYFQAALVLNNDISFGNIGAATLSNGSPVASVVGAGTASGYGVEIVVIDQGNAGLTLIFGASGTDMIQQLVNAIDLIGNSIAVGF